LTFASSRVFSWGKLGQGDADGQHSATQAKPSHGTKRRDSDGVGALFGRQWVISRCAARRVAAMGLPLSARWQAEGDRLGSPAKGVTLAMARGLRDEARAVMVRGEDPLKARRQSEQAASNVPLFGTYALALVDRIEEGFSNPKHRQQWRTTLETYCAPIWARPIDAIDTADVLACLTPIWQSKPETASRVRGRIERGEGGAIAGGRKSRLLARPSRRDLAEAGQALARPSFGACLCRHAGIHVRPTCTSGACCAGARIRDIDGDTDKRSFERPMVGIRPRRGALDCAGGKDESAPRTSRGAVQARAGDRRGTLGSEKFGLRFPRPETGQAAFQHGAVDVARPHGPAGCDNRARLSLDVFCAASRTAGTNRFARSRTTVGNWARSST
jgi:hypothetical protein